MLKLSRATLLAVGLTAVVAAPSGLKRRQDEVVAGLGIPGACRGQCDPWLDLQLACDSQDCRCSERVGDLLNDCSECIESVQGYGTAKLEIESVVRVREQGCAYTSSAAAPSSTSTTPFVVGGTTYINLSSEDLTKSYPAPTIYWLSGSSTLQSPKGQGWPSGFPTSSSSSSSTTTPAAATTTTSSSSASSSSTSSSSSSSPSSAASLSTVSFASAASSLVSAASPQSVAASSTPSSTSGATRLTVGAALGALTAVVAVIV
ncbi:hypothetical protein JCM8547_006515 [Rhodosporidiobolus lusitaniae]